MESIDQKILHDPDNGIAGDCFVACVASIIEKPIGELEGVYEIMADMERVNWYKDFVLLMKSKGYLTGYYYGYDPGFDLYCIASGPSPRFPAVHHSVVWKDGKMIHDPHPDKTGIDGAPADFIYLIKIKEDK